MRLICFKEFQCCIKAKATAKERRSPTSNAAAKPSVSQRFPVEHQQTQKWHVRREKELLAVVFWNRTVASIHLWAQVECWSLDARH